MSLLVQHHTDEAAVALPRAWQVLRAPDRGVLVHARADRVSISLLRPVPPRGPIGSALGGSMTLWDDVDTDPVLGVQHRVLTVSHCGVEQVREEWEWDEEAAVVLRCSCPAEDFDRFQGVFAQVAASVRPRGSDPQPRGTTR